MEEHLFQDKRRRMDVMKKRCWQGRKMTRKKGGKNDKKKRMDKGRRKKRRWWKMRWGVGWSEKINAINGHRIWMIKGTRGKNGMKLLWKEGIREERDEVMEFFRFKNSNEPFVWMKEDGPDRSTKKKLFQHQSSFFISTLLPTYFLPPILHSLHQVNRKTTSSFLTLKIIELFVHSILHPSFLLLLFTDPICSLFFSFHPSFSIWIEEGISDFLVSLSSSTLSLWFMDEKKYK